MRTRGIAVIAAVGLFALPTLAGAASQLTATNVGIGDHPAFVRVVVDFTGTVSAREVEADTFNARSTATLRLNHPGVTTLVGNRSGDGVHAALQSATQGLNIALIFAPHRLKYVSYKVVTSDRLAIDLWKSAPPAVPTQTCGGLTLGSVHAAPGVVVAKGTEQGIFEHQFQVVLRGPRGKILGRHIVHGPGSWSTMVRYSALRRRTGTIEAVAFSPKDGAIECLAQKRVTIPAS